MVEIATIFVFSWLWRTAGRGGFPNALWIRKIVVPYIVFIGTLNMAAALLFSAASMLPITYKDDEITEKNTWWLWLVGAVYGLAVAVLYTDLVICITSFITVASVFACGAMTSDYVKDNHSGDIWYLFEYAFGALLGLAIILT